VLIQVFCSVAPRGDAGGINNEEFQSAPQLKT
jgi:hypothetical protein